MADQDFNIKVVTTADTSGLRQTREEMQRVREQAEKIRQDAGAAALFARIPPGGPPTPPSGGKEGDRVASEIERGILRTAIHAAGIGAIYKLFEGLKEVATELNKITDELDKQGELLVQNAQHMITQSKFAQDDADVLKVSEEALKGIAAQHKTVEELQKKELTTSQKIADNLLHGPTLGARPNQAILDAERAQAQSNETAARASGIAAVRAAELEKERVAALSTADAIQRLNQKIAEQQALQTKHYQQGDIQGYVEASQAIQEYRKQLELATAALEKQQESAYGAASPQAKAILANEKAARDAKAAGDERSADQFQKTADQYRASATSKDLADIQKVTDSYLRAPRPGRKADVGESQELVDQIERQRIAAENAQKQTVQPTVETGTGGPSLTGAAAIEKRQQETNDLLKQMLATWR